MSLKPSIGMPVVTMNPEFCSPWERDASIQEVAQIAEAAHRLGYHHLICRSASVDRVGIEMGAAARQEHALIRTSGYVWPQVVSCRVPSAAGDLLAPRNKDEPPSGLIATKRGGGHVRGDASCRLAPDRL